MEGESRHSSLNSSMLNTINKIDEETMKRDTNTKLRYTVIIIIIWRVIITCAMKNNKISDDGKTGWRKDPRQTCR